MLLSTARSIPARDTPSRRPGDVRLIESLSGGQAAQIGAPLDKARLSGTPHHFIVLIRPAYVTAGGNTINSYDTFVVAPDEFQNLDTLYNGASLSGNVILTVPADNADQGVLAISPDMFSDKVFVAVK